MNNVLPISIVAAFQAMGADAISFVGSQPDATLADREQALLAIWRARSAQALSAMTQAAQLAEDAQLPSACPKGHTTGIRRIVVAKLRSVMTCVGLVNYRRPWFHCAPCGHGWSPTDQRLDIAPQARDSAGLRAWIAFLGATHTFGEGAALLRTLTGLRLPRERIRVVAERFGRGLLAQTDALPAEPIDGLLVVETDGAQVHFTDNQYHEVKVTAVGGVQSAQDDTRPEAQALTNMSYLAARESVSELAPHVAAEVARRSGSGTTTRCMVGDGARWIWDHVSPACRADVDIVDWFHAAEHLWDLADLVYGKDSAAAKTWVHTAKTDLYDHGVLGQKALQERLAGLPDPLTKKEATARATADGYFLRNAQRMDYPRFRAAGLPIGSGAIESAARHVVKARLTGPGMRWSESGAGDVLALRAHLRSRREFQEEFDTERWSIPRAA